VRRKKSLFSLKPAGLLKRGGGTLLQAEEAYRCSGWVMSPKREYEVYATLNWVEGTIQVERRGTALGGFIVQS